MVQNIKISKQSIIKYCLCVALVAVFCFLVTDTSWAQGRGTVVEAPGARAAANAGSDTLGGVITNTFNSSSSIPNVLSAVAYLFGLVLGIMGVLKLREHVESPNQVQIWDPMKRFLAGGAFFALPYMMRVVQETVAKGGDELQGSSFNTSGVSGEGLDAKLVALMKDVWEPMQYLMLGFCYLAGIILLLIGISRLLKTEQEGARGPMGLGTVVTFIVAGILLSMNKILAAAVGSMFGTGAMNSAGLSYTAGMDAAAIGHANAVIGAIMAFVAIIGWISFIRGFFIMRGVAEGNSQASAMAGFTHILGGAIAVNLGGFIKAVQGTLGIEMYGLTISSAEPYLTSVTFIV